MRKIRAHTANKLYNNRQTFQTNQTQSLFCFNVFNIRFFIFWLLLCLCLCLCLGGWLNMWLSLSPPLCLCLLIVYSYPLVVFRLIFFHSLFLSSTTSNHHTSCPLVRFRYILLWRFMNVVAFYFVSVFVVLSFYCTLDMQSLLSTDRVGILFQFHINSYKWYEVNNP